MYPPLWKMSATCYWWAGMHCHTQPFVWFEGHFSLQFSVFCFFFFCCCCCFCCCFCFGVFYFIQSLFLHSRFSLSLSTFWLFPSPYLLPSTLFRMMFPLYHTSPLPVTSVLLRVRCILCGWVQTQECKKMSYRWRQVQDRMRPVIGWEGRMGRRKVLKRGDWGEKEPREHGGWC